MRAALTGLLAILLMAPAVTIAAPPARPSTLGQASTLVQTSALAQTSPLVQTSDIPADPAVRYGVLANGMHYAILRNATPPGEASIRLRIDAGSLHEREDRRGLAHFLEHMVLNGTRNVPEGDFVKRLERAGLRLGADTNAVTTFNETVFKLDLPKADDATLGEALFLLREVADEATLDPKAIDRERGIVQAEERTRANPGYRAAVDSTGFVSRTGSSRGVSPSGSHPSSPRPRARSSPSSTTLTTAPNARPSWSSAMSIPTRWKRRSAPPSPAGRAKATMAPTLIPERCRNAAFRPASSPNTGSPAASR